MFVSGHFLFPSQCTVLSLAEKGQVIIKNGPVERGLSMESLNFTRVL